MIYASYPTAKNNSSDPHVKRLTAIVPLQLVVVRDEGEGIKPENLTNIFDPYFSTKEKGTGLGLTSVHSIISQHEGLIAAASKVGDGTVFKVYLPALLENNQKTEKITEDKVKAFNIKHKILLVDDDPEVCTVCSNLLKSLDCSVIVANNSMQAVNTFIEAKIRNEPFDIAILDLTIPGESGGADTVQQLLQIDKNTKMIVSSGYSDSPIMANYRAHGFSAILAKPYTIEKLTNVLKSVDQAE